MNPQFPLYIVSKGRWESRLTSRTLELMKVPYHIIIEEQEFDQYASVIDPSKLVILDKAYQRNYDAFWKLKDDESRGSGPARNFAWDHSIKRGFSHHWVMDDNIRYFTRLHQNVKKSVADGVCFKVMEDFVLRYENIAMAGPNYDYFAPRKQKSPAYVANTRIFSCNLIRNDIPFRWRCRYNEDADLSVRILKAKWCTVLFNVFLQGKITTQQMKGGNTDVLYKGGTKAKSQMLYEAHPDIVTLVQRYGRDHHAIDMRGFKNNKFVLKKGVTVKPGVNEYGMQLVDFNERI